MASEHFSCSIGHLPLLTQLSHSLFSVWWIHRAELSISAKVTRSERVHWNWPLWMAVNTLFGWMGSFPPQRSYCYRLSDSTEQLCIGLTSNVFVLFVYSLPSSLSLSPSLHGPGNTNVVKENFNSAEIIWTEKKYHCSVIPRADFFVMLARKLPYFPVWRRALAGENQVWQKGEVKVLTNPAAPAGCPHSHGPLGWGLAEGWQSRELQSWVFWVNWQWNWLLCFDLS